MKIEMQYFYDYFQRFSCVKFEWVSQSRRISSTHNQKWDVDDRGFILFYFILLDHKLKTFLFVRQLLAFFLQLWLFYSWGMILLLVFIKFSHKQQLKPKWFFSSLLCLSKHKSCSFCIFLQKLLLDKVHKTQLYKLAAAAPETVELLRGRQAFWLLYDHMLKISFGGSDNPL